MLSAQIIYEIFLTNFELQIFIIIKWIRHENCIQMSTNKPSIGPVVFEITSEIWWKSFKF